MRFKLLADLLGFLNPLEDCQKQNLGIYPSHGVISALSLEESLYFYKIKAEPYIAWERTYVILERRDFKL